MLNPSRKFCLAETDLQGLVKAFTAFSSYVGCTGFKVQRDGQTMLVLNDLNSEDGAQEYAFLRVLEQRGNQYQVSQIESLSVSWVPAEKLAEKIEDCLNSEESYGGVFWVEAEDCTRHKPCALCS